jgi:hypothetical protein
MEHHHILEHQLLPLVELVVLADLLLMTHPTQDYLGEWVDFQSLIMVDPIQLDQRVVEQVRTVTPIAQQTSLVDLVVVVHTLVLMVQQLVDLVEDLVVHMLEQVQVEQIQVLMVQMH